MSTNGVINSVSGARPKTLLEINPSGMRRFGKRLCETCRRPIMNHHILPFRDNEKRSRQYCYRDGTSYSLGMSNSF